MGRVVALPRACAWVLPMLAAAIIFGVAGCSSAPTHLRPENASRVRPKPAPEPKPVPESKPAPTANGLSFCWPVRGRLISARRDIGTDITGINITAPEGTPIKASEDGVVVYAGNELKTYGNLVLIRHADGFVTVYAHASEILVKRDEQVKRGQIIAKSGQTGHVSSLQVHFEIRKDGTPVDPMDYLKCDAR
jgi:murein DD-endopeptidase MepM/ murein hydrolase activator NlpD